jgi:uncharacterized coiled-coil protein SlyX
MKKIIFVASAVLVLSSCNQKELAESNNQKDSLLAVVNEREATINEYISSFNDVERNLDSVSAKQHIISLNSDNTDELKLSQKARINSEIEAINELMDQNRKKIAELNRKFKNSATKNVQLEKMITTLNDQLVKKDQELADLNTRLNSLNAQVAVLQISVDTLTNQNRAQSQIIADKTSALHIAYYVMGKSNDLQDAKIIDRQGGLLGIGKTSKLKEDFDNSKFTQIDYTQTNIIAVNSEIKIITTHPTGSYTLEKDDKDNDHVKNMVITNPDKFWSASKYLVIVKD